MAKDDKNSDGGDGGDEKKYLTAEDLGPILEQSVGAVVNKAMANYSKRIQADFDKKLAAIAEKAKATESEDDEDETDDAPPSSKGKASGIDPELEKRIRASEKRAEAAEKRAKAAEDAAAEEKKNREDADAKRRRGEQDTRILGALEAKVGVKDPDLREAILAKWRVKGLLKEDESNGELLLAVGDADHPFDKGIDLYAKTDEAKKFRPATGASGSGSQGGGRGARGSSETPPPNGRVTKEQAGNALLALLDPGEGEQVQ